MALSWKPNCTTSTVNWRGNVRLVESKDSQRTRQLLRMSIEKQFTRKNVPVRGNEFDKHLSSHLWFCVRGPTRRRGYKGRGQSFGERSDNERNRERGDTRLLKTRKETELLFCLISSTSERNKKKQVEKEKFNETCENLQGSLAPSTLSGPIFYFAISNSNLYSDGDEN